MTPMWLTVNSSKDNCVSLQNKLIILKKSGDEHP